MADKWIGKHVRLLPQSAFATHAEGAVGTVLRVWQAERGDDHHRTGATYLVQFWLTPKYFVQTVNFPFEWEVVGETS